MKLQDGLQHALDVLIDERQNCQNALLIQCRVHYDSCREVGESTIFKSTLFSQLNGNSTLSKDELTWIKFGILCRRPKLFTTANHDYIMFNLGCDCGVCFVNTPEARIVKKSGRPKKLAPIKVWFVGRANRMHRKFGNAWVEYRDPDDLMSRSSNMGIGICWYKKGTNNKWTYDLMDHLMIDLETIELSFISS